MRLSTERSRFLVDNLDLAEATGVDDARWEWFQLRFLTCNDRFAIANKSRQIAISWTFAAEAVAFALLHKQSSIFISINQDESQEKIRYVKSIYHALKVAGLPDIVGGGSRTRIEFKNGSVIESLPAKAPRGKARYNVYADEFAHVRDDRVIYAGMTPVISKGGMIRIGSTPMGASGTFWEIYTQTLKPYPTYKMRMYVPWWQTYAFSTDLAASFRSAGTMPTEERVERFGNDRIQDFFLSLALEDFQQEYECIFVDEATALITWDEIKRCQKEGLLCRQAKATGSDIGDIETAIREVARLCNSNKIESILVGGMDVGRTRDTSEITLTGYGDEQHPVRLTLELNRMPFEQQSRVIDLLFEYLPLRLLMIDRNGIGMMLAEQALQKYGDEAIRVNFTNDSKKDWATRAKKAIQQASVQLPVDKNLAYQIHSIKRIVTGSRNLVFDTERNEKHHADKFWSLALALAADRRWSKLLVIGSGQGSGGFDTYG